MSIKQMMGMGQRHNEERTEGSLCVLYFQLVPLNKNSFIPNTSGAIRLRDAL